MIADLGSLILDPESFADVNCEAGEQRDRRLVAIFRY